MTGESPAFCNESGEMSECNGTGCSGKHQGQPCRAGGGEALKTSRRSHNEIDHETTGGLWLDMIQLHCVDLQSFSRCGTGLDVEYQRIDGFYLPKKDRFT